MVYLILLYIFPVISESVIPNSLGSYIRIRYINIQFCVISVSVISDSVILVSIISDSYLVISDSLYLIPLYQNLLYQIHCGRLTYKCLEVVGVVMVVVVDATDAISKF